MTAIHFSGNCFVHCSRNCFIACRALAIFSQKIPPWSRQRRSEVARGLGVGRAPGLGLGVGLELVQELQPKRHAAQVQFAN
eukprot:77506-Pelagomonas_calceolata.AAC.4